MARRRPVKDAATEVEALAIEARELLARLTTDGINVSVELPVLGKRTIHIQLPAEDAGENEVGNDVS